MRVFQLPNFKARGELVLEFWWHINPHIAYKLRLQGYICDKFVYGPTEKDDVYLLGYLSPTCM